MRKEEQSAHYNAKEIERWETFRVATDQLQLGQRDTMFSDETMADFGIYKSHVKNCKTCRGLVGETKRKSKAR